MSRAPTWGWRESDRQIYYHTFLIAGPSCAGKTTLTDEVIRLLNARDPSSAVLTRKHTTKANQRARDDHGLLVVSAADFDPTRFAYTSVYEGSAYGIPHHAFEQADADRFLLTADPKAAKDLIEQFGHRGLVPVLVTEENPQTLEDRLMDRLKSQVAPEEFSGRAKRLEDDWFAFRDLMNQGRFKYVIMESNGTTASKLPAAHPAQAIDYRVNRLAAIVTFERTTRHYPRAFPDLHNHFINTGLRRLFGVGTFREILDAAKAGPVYVAPDSPTVRAAMADESVSPSYMERVLQIPAAPVEGPQPKEGVIELNINYDGPCTSPADKLRSQAEAERLRPIFESLFSHAYFSILPTKRGDATLIFRLTDVNPVSAPYRRTSNRAYALQVNIFPNLQDKEQKKE